MNEGYTVEFGNRPRCDLCRLLFLTPVELTMHIAATHAPRTVVPPPSQLPVPSVEWSVRVLEPREITEHPQGSD